MYKSSLYLKLFGILAILICHFLFGSFSGCVTFLISFYSVRFRLIIKRWSTPDPSEYSIMANIGLSFVQGSGIGPTLYIVMKSDLHVVSRTNEIIKFADDTTILVPENTDVGLDVEFRQVSKWADINRLTLNTAKTKEIVFRRPKVKYFHMPPAIDSIQHVDCCKLLAVFCFQSSLKGDMQRYITKFMKSGF